MLVEMVMAGGAVGRNMRYRFRRSVMGVISHVEYPVARVARAKEVAIQYVINYACCCATVLSAPNRPSCPDPKSPLLSFLPP
jgi:hypothetical protein